jgi:endonuclease/exonuclease/phosphatase family metal-dependent hydrolase
MKDFECRWPAVLLVGLAFSLLAVSCSGEGSAAPPRETAGAEEATVRLKVMTFNVLYGAGHDRRFDEHVGQRFKGRDRMPELLAFLREADPDVLAIEEAAGWDTGDPSVAEQVAAALGMNFVLAPDAWELHVVLFSKYPIVAADYVSRLQDFNGVALRTTLAITPELTVNVLAVHLNSMSRLTRSCQVEALLDMTEGLEGRTILLGDMNFRPDTDQAEALREGGLQLVVAQPQWPIDQIWIDLTSRARPGGWWETLDSPPGISDHLPIGVDLTIQALPSGVAGHEPVTEPGALDYECPLP